MLGGEKFCLDIPHVKEIVAKPQAAAVPGQAKCVLGVINLRGVIMPLVDLRGLLGMAPGGAAGQGKAVIVQRGAHQLGLAVDDVLDVEELGPGQFVGAEDLVDGERRLFVRDLVRRGEELMIRLEAEAIFRALPGKG